VQGNLSQGWNRSGLVAEVCVGGQWCRRAIVAMNEWSMIRVIDEGRVVVVAQVAVAKVKWRMYSMQMRRAWRCRSKSVD
jgi:hypothetical protein